MLRFSYIYWKTKNVPAKKPRVREEQKNILLEFSQQQVVSLAAKNKDLWKSVKSLNEEMSHSSRENKIA